MSSPSSPVPSSPGGPAGPASPPQRSYRYRWWEASLVALDAVGGLLFAWTGVGAVFLLLGFVYALWRDRRGVVSLRGVLPWSRLSRVEQIGLAFILVLGAPLFFWIYCFQIVYEALRGASGGSSLGGRLRALGARIRAWPRAWQVMGALIASALVCACCASGIAVLGANSPTPPTSTGGNGGGSSHSVTALTVPQMTATAQALRTSQAAQATATAQQSVVDEDATATALAAPTATATPRPSPTTPPTVTPRPTAKPQPTKTPVPYVLSVTVTCAYATDYSYGQVCVHTHAGAQLTITVTYCSGHVATSKSLQGTVTANGSGNYTWSWTPETTCRGSADAYITDSWNGQYASTDKSFNVQ